MFSAKLITTLTLVLVAINAVAAGMHSQCSQWKSSSGLSQSLSESKTIMAKVMRSKIPVSKPPTSRFQRRITPPNTDYNDLDTQSEAVCSAQGYDTEKVDGVCLWTGEGQSYKSSKYYPGWLNGDHTENCGRKISLKNAHANLDAPIIDGCSFANPGQTIDQDFGCASIYVTRLTFAKLGGKPSEHQVPITNWDFKGKDGN
ncbi:hypothetical protein PGTUg99_025605 [Puccinia graminis f. sp. tritici]|uniref:Secreted protein n=1 Tax=Puccinia graminis f. sp. tritici TaxID=56615 RepID=A0A5B0M9P7_PUCGR|nr:hypothetical protein PGTUg99_025605 [Puccinia graminis f. sp. tritici]